MIKYYKLQNYLLNYKDVVTINYKTELNTRLRRKNTFVRGVLTEVIYYSGLEIVDGEEVFDDEILKVRMHYNRDEKGNVISRTTVRSYVYSYKEEYGEDIKVTHKHYNEIESLNEGIRRRTNVYLEIYKMLKNLDTSRPDLIMFRDKVLNYFELHKASYINLGLPIDMQEVKNLDVLFETEKGKQALAFTKGMMAMPVSEHYIEPKGELDDN